jgi:PAS domain S-box-containing protein
LIKWQSPKALKNCVASKPGSNNNKNKRIKDLQIKECSILQNAIFNSANFSSIATDANGVIQIFNVGAENMLGYKADEVLNKLTPADISDPQEVIKRATALSKELETPIAPGFEALVFKASRSIEDIYELSYIRKNGSRFPAIVSVTALRNEQNIIIGYLLIGTDNSARKHAEEALLKAGALQKAIFNSANFSSIATDANGVIQIFNVGAENMLGYKADEVVNKLTPADISDPQEVIARATALSKELEMLITPGFEALVFKASRGIEDIYELTYIRKNNSRFPAVVSVTALRSEQNIIIGYLLIGTDNTARKHAEDTVRKLSLAVEQSASAIEITDLNANIEYVNEAFVKLSGYSCDELIGKNSRLLSAGKTDKVIYQAMWATLSAGNSWQGEFINKTKQGAEYTELTLISPIRQSNGEITHYLAVKENVTQRKHNEALLLVAIERAEALAKSKAQFLANMSHEIRTPMNGIIGFSELALLKDMPTGIRDYLKKINTTSLGLLNILNDILDLSKLEAGGIHINLAHFVIDELRDVLHGLFIDLSHNKDLNFTLTIAPDVPRYLIGDRLRLEQVLINLLGNAIKFTLSGSVALNISLQQLQQSQARLLFCITDTGIGISATDQDKLFHPFSQVDDSITRRFGGTGLGLALSHDLVQLMGGELSLVSELDQGSCFSFELTLAVSPLSSKGEVLDHWESLASVLQKFSLQLTGFRILVAEDNLFNQQIIQEFLNLSGINVDIANDGQEAIALLAITKFDAVLMDIHMPIMDGFEATRQIRGLPGFSALPIIALTAGVTKEERKRCLAAGMNDFINKPINPALLLSTLAHWLKFVDIPVTATDAAPSQAAFQKEPLTAINLNMTLTESVLPAKAVSIADNLPPSAMDRNMCILRELVGDDPDTIAKFLGFFHASANKISADIITALTAGDVISASNAAHKLSASAHSVGALRLGDLCLQIEEAGNTGDKAMLNNLLPDFEEEWHRVEKYLLAWPDEPN